MDEKILYQKVVVPWHAKDSDSDSPGLLQLTDYGNCKIIFYRNKKGRRVILDHFGAGERESAIERIVDIGRKSRDEILALADNKAEFFGWH